MLELENIITEEVSLKISPVSSRTSDTKFNSPLLTKATPSYLPETTLVSESPLSSLTSSPLTNMRSTSESHSTSVIHESSNTSSVQSRSIMLINLDEDVNQKDTIELYFENSLDPTRSVECDKQGQRAIITLRDSSCKYNTLL